MPLGNTSYLQIPLMAENDNQKYVLSNDAMQAFDDALNRLVVLDFTASDVTLLESQLTRYQMFRGTGGAVPRTFTIPATVGSGPTVTTNRFIIFDNQCTDSVTVTHGGAGVDVVVPASTTTLIFADGLDIVSVASASGFSMGIRDEGGGDFVTDPTFLDFIGNGIDATLDGFGASITVTLPEVQDDGVSQTTDTTLFNFTGPGVTITPTGDTVEVAIPGGGGTDIETQDDGVQIVAATDTINFTGPGVTTTNPSGNVTEVAIPGGTDLETQDDGVQAVAATDTLNFTGAGVTTTNPSGNVTEIAIPGGGGSPIETQDDGVQIVVATDTINFTGAGVTTTNPSGDVTEVAIPGGGADIETQDDGAQIVAATDTINFTGPGVVVTNPSAAVTEVNVRGITLQEDTTTAYVVTDSDLSGDVFHEQNNAAANTVTINSGLVGTQPLTIMQSGAGQTTIVAGGGVTINSSGGNLKLGSQYSAATLVPKGSNVYMLFGDLVA